MTDTNHCEDCTGWHIEHEDAGALITARVRRCTACNPDGQYPPERAPWVDVLFVDGVVQARASA